MTTMSLGTITTGSAPRPPRLVVYGEHGIGKTTFAAAAPNPIVLRTEDGLGALRVPTFPLAASFEDVLAAITELYTQPHIFQTLVLDSLDWLEPLVWARTALVHGKENIEDFGYGKGYKFAAEIWAELLRGLAALNEQRGMTVIAVAHASIKRFDAPDTEPYDRYQIKLHDRASDLVQEWADVVAFAHYEVAVVTTDVGFNKNIARGIGTGARRLGVEARPAYQAKNRYRLPAVLPLSWDHFAQACAPAFATRGGSEPEPLPSPEIINNSTTPAPAAEPELAATAS